MKQFSKDFWPVLIVTLSVLFIVLAVIGVESTPVDHTLHTYILHLTNGEIMTVQYERCKPEAFWSNLYAICGINGHGNAVAEQWRAQIVALEEVK